MGLFSSSENDVEQAPGGFLKRLRGARSSSFVEPGLAASAAGVEPRFEGNAQGDQPERFLPWAEAFG